MMVERLKHEGTSRSSSDLLKIFVKMGASLSAQDFRQAGLTSSNPRSNQGGPMGKVMCPNTSGMT